MQFEQSNLFKAVQMQAIFSDSKQFADAIPKVSWEQACALYDNERPQDLTEFVARHFDFAPQPELTELHATSVKDYIDQLWQRLARAPQTGNASSLLDLPASYTVPGGRFNEIYYWDSYFTALGLMDAGHVEQVSNMLDNFVSLIERIGHVPNGNRSYYTSRSQPPVTALMVSLLWQSHHQDKTWLSKVTDALQKEHSFWMADSDQLNDELTESRRVVRMPCGGVMNRFWDDCAQPRLSPTKRISSRPVCWSLNIAHCFIVIFVLRVSLAGISAVAGWMTLSNYAVLIRFSAYLLTSMPCYNSWSGNSANVTQHSVTALKAPTICNYPSNVNGLFRPIYGTKSKVGLWITTLPCKRAVR